eukprot:m.137005 g.137005  ORF g.137005 m.137005 type:complete len:54 (+) comp15883_c1_seq1:458-619(+)
MCTSVCVNVILSSQKTFYFFLFFVFAVVFAVVFPFCAFVLARFPASVLVLVIV